MNVSGPMKLIELNHADMDVRILGNFDLTRQTMDPRFSKTGSWYSYFSGDTLEVTDTHEAISLAPGEYRIYTTKKLEKPMITSVNRVKTDPADVILTYPVPARSQLFIESEKIVVSYSVYDTGGRLVAFREPGSRRSVLDVSLYNPGIYILRINLTDGSLAHKKFMVK